MISENVFLYGNFIYIKKLKSVSTDSLLIDVSDYKRMYFGPFSNSLNDMQRLSVWQTVSMKTINR